MRAPPLRESAEHEPGVASLVIPSLAGPPEPWVDVQQPTQLPQAADPFHPHDEGGPEEASWASRGPARSAGMAVLTYKALRDTEVHVLIQGFRGHVFILSR